MVAELEEVPRSIVGGLDIHRKQLTFDYVEVETGRLARGRIVPADREHLAGWLSRFDGRTPVAFAMEGARAGGLWPRRCVALASSRTWPSRPRPPRCAGRNGGPRRTRPMRSCFVSCWLLGGYRVLHPADTGAGVAGAAGALP